jgi:hypothetical protein
VLPVEPTPKEKPVLERRVRTMEVLTGRIIDVVV